MAQAISSFLFYVLWAFALAAPLYWIFAVADLIRGNKISYGATTCLIWVTACAWAALIVFWFN